MTYTLMTFEEYMSEILKYERASLGDTENRFLHFIMGEPKSAYTIFSLLKEKNRPIAYKNVHTRIKRLEDLKLIQKSQGRFARRAIKYKLTTQGLFHLLSQYIAYKLGIFWNDLWKYYADDIIVRTLILPYFEIDTMKNAQRNLSSSVLSYLRNCYFISMDGCEYIKKFMKRYRGPTDTIVEVHLDNLLDINEPVGTTDPSEPEAYTIKSATDSLKKELEWEAKEMAFGLITKPVSSFGVFLALTGKIDIERVGKTGVDPEDLGRDKRFMKLLYQVQKDFDRGFKAANTVAI
jgi:DNA-binding MarR family transcriptional regulator